MYKWGKLWLVGLGVAVLLASAVSAASGNRLSVSEARYNLRWTLLEFILSTGDTIVCEVSLAGSFHSSTMNKTIGSLMGHVTTAAASRTCLGGAVTMRAETLPWHVQYGGFAGALPNIETVRLNLIGARFRILPSGGVACEGGTTQIQPGALTIHLERGQARSVSAAGTIETAGSFFCSATSVAINGSGSMTTPAGGTVTIRLI